MGAPHGVGAGVGARPRPRMRARHAMRAPRCGGRGWWHGATVFTPLLLVWGYAIPHYLHRWIPGHHGRDEPGPRAPHGIPRIPFRMRCHDRPYIHRCRYGGCAVSAASGAGRAGGGCHATVTDDAAHIALHDTLYSLPVEQCDDMFCPNIASGEQFTWDGNIRPACADHADPSLPSFPNPESFSHGWLCECAGCDGRRAWQAARLTPTP